jgi:hypothetical protein
MHLRSIELVPFVVRLHFAQLTLPDVAEACATDVALAVEEVTRATHGFTAYR